MMNDGTSKVNPGGNAMYLTLHPKKGFGVKILHERVQSIAAAARRCNEYTSNCGLRMTDLQSALVRVKNVDVAMIDRVTRNVWSLDPLTGKQHELIYVDTERAEVLRLRVEAQKAEEAKRALRATKWEELHHHVLDEVNTRLNKLNLASYGSSFESWNDFTLSVRFRSEAGNVSCSCKMTGERECRWSLDMAGSGVPDYRHQELFSRVSDVLVLLDEVARDGNNQKMLSEYLSLAK